MVQIHSTPDVAQTLGLDQASGSRKRQRRWLLLTLLLLALVVVAGVWSMRGANGAPQYKTQNAQRGDLTVVVTATGNLEPTNQVEVGIEVSGTIAGVEVDYNHPVEVGQILARLDTTKFEAQVLKSKAALQVARAKVLQVRATVREMQAELARLQQVRKLSGGKVPSQHDLDAAEASLDRAQADETSAKAAVSGAQATLDVDETNLAKAIIHSPISGIVLNRNVDPGQTVAASLQTPVLFTLAEDLREMELHVGIDEADVGQVGEGQEATFTVDAYPNRIFPARITQVRYGAEEVDGVITYETVLIVDNADLSLRPGMTATADITVQQIEAAVLVPNAALRFTPVVQEKETSSGGGFISKLLPRPPSSGSKPRQDTAAHPDQQLVWALRDGQPVSIPITIGATDGIMTEVAGGDLDPGMALLVDTLGGGG